MNNSQLALTTTIQKSFDATWKGKVSLFLHDSKNSFHSFIHLSRSEFFKNFCVFSFSFNLQFSWEVARWSVERKKEINDLDDLILELNEWKFYWKHPLMRLWICIWFVGGVENLWVTEVGSLWREIDWKYCLRNFEFVHKLLKLFWFLHFFKSTVGQKKSLVSPAYSFSRSSLRIFFNRKQSVLQIQSRIYSLRILQPSTENLTGQKRLSNPGTLSI